jgi:anhydro-N-acetylmuramic acid kinase
VSRDGELYVGLMSGTSLDGVDVAIVDFGQFPPQILYCATDAYPAELRAALQQLCRAQTTSLDALYTLDARLGDVYADSVERALQAANIGPREVTALGCHGQTLRHSPDSDPPYSVQIGDPNRLAARCGIATVADFRGKDIALGGQAAPLAPAYHRFLFHSTEEDRVVVNIGGIANITWLPADRDAKPLGFDTGPGNTLLNYWSEKYRGAAYDDDGAWARGGRVDDALLNRILAGEPYFRACAPKSTGTEYFSADWLENRLPASFEAQDIQATLTELTAATIADALTSLPGAAANCFVCGGGAHNGYLLERLRGRLADCGLQTTDALGMNPDYVEAAAFAWLARERVNRRPGNIPAITNASRETLLGAVYAAE